MAHPRVRAAQEQEARARLVAEVQALADAHGIEAVDIPTRHKDPSALPMLQMNAISDFLASVTIAAGGTPAVMPTESEPAEEEAAESEPATTTTEKPVAVPKARR